MKQRLLNRIFEWLQRRCVHKPDWVRADLLEGACEPYRVQWCLRCGTVRIQHDGINWELRSPRATWADDTIAD